MPDAWIDILGRLAVRRPAFWSEADFQFELAWEIRSRAFGRDIRLERPVKTARGGIAVDLLVARPSGPVAVELKYRKAAFSEDVAGETMTLGDQSAQDEGRYGFLVDVARLESLVREGHATGGTALLLSNDQLYWTAPKGGSRTRDAAFRLHEGRRVAGLLEWAPGTPRTTCEAKPPIVLEGAYDCRWRDYARPGSGRNGLFRYLLLPVG